MPTQLAENRRATRSFFHGELDKRLSVNANDKPYGDKGFIVFPKAGDGAIFCRNNTIIQTSSARC